jgi:uracil-DNA glycosylase
MTTHQLFNLDAADASWHACLTQALEKMEPLYLEKLYTSQDWLPQHNNIFNAFSLPVSQTHYILFGESPYPRAASANGYAFWDAAVNQLWSETGLSKSVNRATSLRNIIKMLLIIAGKLAPQRTSQADIASLDKHELVSTNQELFNNFLKQGFLLLNATPVLSPEQVQKDARAWQPFIKHILTFIVQKNPNVQLVLLGNIANAIDKLIDNLAIKRIYAEHPYNISFMHNPVVTQFFQPFNLLHKNSSF